MLEYNSMDIVRRARQLADLENSDFISWNENLSLLNEAYRKLYQKAIDSNDKYYLCLLDFNMLVQTKKESNEIRYKLPCNFYQLASIASRVDCSPILRKASSEGKTLRRYDIIGDEIVLYGSLGPKDVEVSYYPLPQTLTLKAPTKVFTDLASNSLHALDCNGNRYLCYASEDRTVYMYDIATSKKTSLVTLEAGQTIQWALIGKRTYVLNIGASVIVGDFINGSSQSEGITNALYGKSEGDLYKLVKNVDNDTWGLFKGDSENFSRLVANGMELEVPEIASTAFYPFTFVNEGSAFDFYFLKVKESGAMALYRTTEGTTALEEETEITDLHYTVLDGDLYCVNYDVLINGCTHLEGDFLQFVGFNKADAETGYGMSVINDDGNLAVHSYLSDTELNFPHNFYFNYIAYMLAIAYKAKQNASTDILYAQASEEELAFYDSMTRDTAQYTRISNVYANGGW